MVLSFVRKSCPVFFCLMALLVCGAVLAGGVSVGKNPGEIKGRWLKVEDVAALKAYRGVYIGQVTSDIQWKKAENEAPIDEKMLDEDLRKQLLERLRESGALGEVLDGEPSGGGYIRLDCDLTVEPGSRAARYMLGMGAGKSRSILEIHLRDGESGKDLGLYHGYGVGTGLGFKVAGGGARKMTMDDIQENSKEFVKLLKQAGVSRASGK